VTKEEKQARYVMITRHPRDCRELQELVQPHGIVIWPYPVLRLEDSEDKKGWRTVLRQLPADASSESGRNGWLVLASPRAPERFVNQARQRGAEHLLALPVAAVGTGTAEAAAAAGLAVSLTGPGSGAGLAGQMLPELAPASPIVFACGHDRRPELPAALSAAGHQVLPVVVYRMRPTPPRELPPLRRVDLVVLTSPRAARYYLEGVGGKPLPCPHMALGQTTRSAAAGLGIECRIPEQPTMKSLAEELCQI
jgi:uroporphyrinogen-III synthase